MPPYEEVTALKPGFKGFSGSSAQPSQGNGQGNTLDRIAHTLELLSEPLLTYLEQQTLTQQDKDARFTDIQPVLDNSPIGSLLRDDSITDIMINGPTEIFIVRAGKIEKTSQRFPDERSLQSLAELIVQGVGRSIDAARPLADARLKDGSRVNIIAPPMAVNGLSMSIRKFPKHEITLESLVEKGSMTQQMADFLKLCAESRVSMLVSGGTGTGKTTMLNAISHYIPSTERIVTIEDTAELRLQQPHVVRLETKEPQMYGDRRDEVNTADLVRNALRMRPDRIIVGEVRGVEAFDMVQAMNTGHEGSMTTIHANAPRDALTRLENLLAPVFQNTQASHVRRQLVSALNLIIQLGYTKNGKRIVTSIADVVGMEGDIPTMQEIFVLKEDTMTEPGTIIYRHEWTKILPRHQRLVDLIKAQELFPVPQIPAGQ